MHNTQACLRQIGNDDDDDNANVISFVEYELFFFARALWTIFVTMRKYYGARAVVTD